MAKPAQQRADACLSAGEFVARYIFRRDDQIVINDVAYVCEYTSHEAHTLMRVNDGLPEIFTHEQIQELIRHEKLVVHDGHYHPGRAEVSKRTGGKRFYDLTTKQKENVLFKKAICDRYMEREKREDWIARTDDKLRIVIRQIMAERDAANRDRCGHERCGHKIGNQEKEPSPTTLRRWLSRYERADFDVMALVEYYKAPARKSQLSHEAYKIHIDFVRQYASKKKPSKRLVYEYLCEHIDDLNEKRAEDDPEIETLSRRAFERMIDKLDPVHTIAGRESVDAARKKYRPVTQGLDVTAPFERLEFDEWHVDLMALLAKADVLDDMSPEEQAKIPRKRLWLSAAIDARTRVIVAMRFIDEAPSEASAVSTLEMAIMPNVEVEEAVGASEVFPSGTPEAITCDNGPGYVSRAMQRRILEIGATPMLPPAGFPELRGRIERCFRTAKDSLVRRFSGQTFANVVEKGDADPAGDASLTAEELNKLMVRGVLDIYNNSPHEGLGGETPNDCFNRLSKQYGIRKPPTGEHRRCVFGIPAQRRISQEGILVAGVRYRSKEVDQLRRTMRQKPVDVRVDRFDMGRISVWHSKGGGWISVPARVDGLDGVSFWRWTAVVKDLKKRFAQNSKLRKSVVRQAMRDIENASHEAELRAAISPTIMTESDFLRIEREVFKDFSIVDDEDDAEGLGLDISYEADDVDDENVANPDEPHHKTGDENSSRVEDDYKAVTDGAPTKSSNGETRVSDGLFGDPENDEDDDDEDDIFGDPNKWKST